MARKKSFLAAIGALALAVAYQYLTTGNVPDVGSIAEIAANSNPNATQYADDQRANESDAAPQAEPETSEAQSNQTAEPETTQATESRPAPKTETNFERAIVGGVPIIERRAINGKVQLLDNGGFAVAYSEARRNPLWVAYTLRRLDRTRSIRRPDDFEVDDRTNAQVDTRDYSRSGYTRGHMAPNYAIFQLYGKDDQFDTFLMSNVTPQRPNLNNKLWQRLEEVEFNEFTKRFETIQVITGPLFDNQREHMRSGIEIPDAFFKIYVGEKRNGDQQTLAFIMPQEVNGDEPLDRYLTTIDNIEQRSGIDFLAALNDSDENAIESSKGNPAPWDLARVARLPGRYR